MDFSRIVKKSFREAFKDIFLEVESVSDGNPNLSDDGRRFVEIGFYDENVVAGVVENLTRFDFCYNYERRCIQGVDLFVLPCKRGLGLGSSLVNVMEDVAFLTGCERIEIAVRNNSGARDFWRKRAYFPVDRVYWKKLL
jgi:GNAT superfamily N-acetyltransferase